MAQKKSRKKKKKVSKLETETYPNSPLVEVVLQIQFPGEPAIETKRDQIFEHFRSKFPKVLVPKLSEGQSSALEPYHFQTGDGTESIITAINSFAYSTRNYKGYRTFQKNALNCIGWLGRKFKLSKLNRIGLRYVNAIYFARDNDLVPLSRFLNLSLNTPASIPDKFKEIKFAFVSKTPTGQITTQVGCAVDKQTNQEAIVLDFDYNMTDNLRFSKLREYLNKSHLNTKRIFEDLITDDYRGYMRGEVIP